MRCPACRLTLATFEVENVELDFCVEGHGYWLDEGELEVLLAAPGAVLEKGCRGRRGKRRCPRCERRLVVHEFCAEVELDLCPVGDGIWFDEGELGALLAELAQRGQDVEGSPLARSLDSLTRHFGNKS